MKKLFSTRYNATAFNLGLLLLRIGAGVLMAHHGFQKIQNYDQWSHGFINFMGLGPTVSYMLAIFAEFFCAILIVLGLFTRLACFVLVINCTVALSTVHWDLFDKGELLTLFLACYLTLLFTGPGKVSVDGLISK